MGTDRCTRTTLVARCCHGAFFGFGFVSTILTLTVMFWIAWCYFGLTILQISDTQRRAVVNYSYVTSKPLPTSTTAAPSRSSTATAAETSINSISKSPTTASIPRGSSRDAAVTPPEREASKKKDVPQADSGAPAATLSVPEVEESDDRVYARRVLSSGSENKAVEKSELDDRSIRRNFPVLVNASRLDISPTKVFATASAGESSKVESNVDKPSRDEVRTQSREFVDREKSDPQKRDDIQSSRRPDPEPVYREPDFDREYPKRYTTTSDRGSSRFDDFDDERGSRGRYEKRERGRESDDRYSKGDTRVYPDDKILDRNPSTDEEKYRVRERYPDGNPRRGDDERYDDRYRDYDEKSRIRDRDETKYKDRDLDRPLSRSDRDRDDERYKYTDDEKNRPRDDDRYSYRDDDRYRTRDDDRYRTRDDDRYRPRDDDRYRPRDDDRYRPRDDDRQRPRDDDRQRPRDDDRYTPRDDDRLRPRDDDRYTPRDDDRQRPRDDDRQRPRDDDKYKPRDEDTYRPRNDDRYRDGERYEPRDGYRVNDGDKYSRKDETRYGSDLDDQRNVPVRSINDKDRYYSRSDDDKYTDTATSRIKDTGNRESTSKSIYSYPIGDRKPTGSRSQYEESYRDRDRDDRYISTRYDEDRVKNIAPTRTRIDSTFSRTSSIDSIVKDRDEDRRYAGNTRDRIKTDRFYGEDERNPATKLEDSRSTTTKSESSRTYIDDRDKYHTGVPDEKIYSSKINDRGEVILDRRSYASEEGGDSRRGVSRTRSYYEDRSRSPTEDTRIPYRDDELYVNREYSRDKPRDDNSRDRRKSPDRDEDDYRRYDDRYPLRDDRLPSSTRKYDTYPEDDERSRRRDSETRTLQTDETRKRGETIRPSASSRDEERLYDSDDFPETKSSRGRYEDELSQPDEYDTKHRDSDARGYYGDSRRPATSRDPVLGSSMSSGSSREPTDVVNRGKRFPSSDSRFQSSRVITDERSYMDSEPDSTEYARPPNPKDVIEAVIRQFDNPRNVNYPVRDPRMPNSTSTEIIRAGDRRGITSNTRKRRSA